MREVERTRFLDATPAELQRVLSPSTVLEAEGTFSVVETADTVNADGHREGMKVWAEGGGVTAVFVFTGRDDGLDYRQVGESGPFETMETSIRYTASDHGSEMTARSSVSLGLPITALTDRIAAWKRGGELERLLDGLAAQV